MQFEIYSDLAAFRAAAYDLLLRHEDQNNLLLSFIGNEHGADSSGWLLGTVRDETGKVVLTFACTPPFNIVLYETDNRPAPAAVELLASELKSRSLPVPGVLAEQGLARRFAEAYAGADGYRSKHLLQVMRLDQVAELKPSAGGLRELRREDLFFVPYWLRAFHEEAGVLVQELPVYIGQAERNLGQGAFYLWEDDFPVAQACYARSTANGAAISAVYTPPSFRGRGYATSLVAGLSRLLLARGKQFCCLFVDLDNPVSCSIYRKIGYVERCAMEELEWGECRPQGN